MASSRLVTKSKAKVKKKQEPLPLKPVDHIPAFSRYQHKSPEVEENDKQKLVRRNKPAGEDVKKLKEILRSLKNQAPISVQEFIGLVGPSTGDNGDALREILAEEMKNFRNTTRKVYETMTQDISDVLTNEHIQLQENSKERHQTYLQRVQMNNNEIYSMCEDFDFDMFFNLDGYLDAKFPTVPQPDLESEDVQALMRQEAYHRYNWLKSEGERLKEENARLQKRLAYLKRQQKEELKIVADREQQAEEDRRHLENQQEELQEKLEELNESVGKTLVETELDQTKVVNLVGKPKQKKKVPRSSFREARPEWAAQAAAEIESTSTGQALMAETSRISMRANSMSVTSEISQMKKRKKIKKQHFSPIKTPPSPRKEPRDLSPFHYSPQRSPQTQPQERVVSPFHYSPKSRNVSPTPPSPTRVRLETTTSVMEERPQPMRRGRAAGPRDSWGGFGCFVVIIQKGKSKIMAEQVAFLNDDFNYNMFLAKTIIANLETITDRQKTVKWIKKLSNCNRSMDELKLRNDFMYYLVLNIQNGTLRAPFNENPPPGPLPNLASLLPSAGAGGLEQAGTWADREGTPEKPLLYQHSPDGGAFLASQPVPRCGAYCYLAVISRTPK